MKKYIVQSRVIEEDAFFEKMEGLEQITEKLDDFPMPAAVVQYSGTPKQLYELLGYTPREVEILPVKKHRLPKRY